MPVLKNARHEKFAQLVASGKTQADAYRAVYPKSLKWKDADVHTESSRLFPKVSPRVKELLEASAAKASIQKEEVVAFLAEAIRTPVGDIDEKNKLAQEVEVTTLMGDGVRIKTKSVSKMQAAELLAKLLGWNAPEKRDDTIRFAPDEDTIRLLKG